MENRSGYLQKKLAGSKDQVTEIKIMNHLSKIIFISLLLFPVVISAQQKTNEDIDDPARDYFTDTILINQYGEEMKFYEDLLKDKIVVINAFHIDCKNTCPIMHSSIAKINKHVGERVGKDIYLISITIDPTNDTPEKLSEYSKQFTEDPGWFFLSGDIENVNSVTKKLGKYVTNSGAHDSVLLMGNLSTGLWKKVNGLAAPAEIIEVFDSVVNDEGGKF